MGLSNFFSSLFGKAKEKAEIAKENLSEVAENVAEKAADVAEDVKETVENVAEKASQKLEELKVNVNKWIETRKNIQVIEMKVSGPSKTTPPEFFIRLSYDDKAPARVVSNTAPPAAKRR